MTWTLITGASSGIGKALSYCFAKKSHNLVLLARNNLALKQLSQSLINNYAIKTQIIPLDLSTQDAAVKIKEKLDQLNIKIDYLVNNAGLGNYGNFELSDYATDLELINVNILALTMLSKLFLPYMIANNQGGILNISSIASFVPGPYMNTYFASKAYVTSFTIALANELNHTNILVSAACPGPTPTNFGKRAHFNNTIKRNHKIPVNDVAQAITKQFFKKKLIIIPGYKNKLIPFLARLIPLKNLANLVKKASGFK
jgi:uncharacterized protein